MSPVTDMQLRFGREFRFTIARRSGHLRQGHQAVDDSQLSRHDYEGVTLRHVRLEG